jgi:uncharacterized protein (DUF1499 family)
VRRRRLAAGAGLALVALLAAGAVYVRAVEHDPALWDVDPLTAARADRPNEAWALPAAEAAEGDLLSPVYAETPEALLARLDSMLREEPRVRRLDDGADPRRAAYVALSRVVGFPDYVTVRAVEAEGGATLAIRSRSRFGYGDMGVNRARLERWLGMLD